MGGLREGACKPGFCERLLQRKSESSAYFHQICFSDPPASVNVSGICQWRPGNEWDAARVAVDPSLSPEPQAERERQRKEGWEVLLFLLDPNEGGCIGIGKLQTPPPSDD